MKPLLTSVAPLRNGCSRGWAWAYALTSSRSSGPLTTKMGHKRRHAERTTGRKTLGGAARWRDERDAERPPLQSLHEKRSPGTAVRRGGINARDSGGLAEPTQCVECALPSLLQRQACAATAQVDCGIPPAGRRALHLREAGRIPPWTVSGRSKAFRSDLSGARSASRPPSHRADGWRASLPSRVDVRRASIERQGMDVLDPELVRHLVDLLPDVIFGTLRRGQTKSSEGRLAQTVFSVLPWRRAEFGSKEQKWCTKGHNWFSSVHSQCLSFPCGGSLQAPKRVNGAPSADHS